MTLEMFININYLYEQYNANVNITVNKNNVYIKVIPFHIS